jgi:aminomethyltransferase
MVDFAGWDMPVLYTSILDEARAVRGGVGLFDISHMGRIRLFGEGTTALLQSLTSNDVEALNPSEAQYSLLTNAEGGVIDDIIVYREADEAYLVVINASNAEKDIVWIRQHLPASVSLEDWSDRTAMIAVQGPEAPSFMARLAENDTLLELKRFQYATAELFGIETVFCRTGYTGEDGFEVILAAEQVELVWNRLVEAGGVPCGLGARDALRIEAGYPLYGHEIDDTTSPVEAALMWVVSLEKPVFTGHEAIRRVKAEGAKRRLVGLLLPDERMVPRQDFLVYSGDTAVGKVTSGVFSPTKSQSIAMGYVEVGFAKTGTAVSIEIRNKRVNAVVVPKKSLLS